MWRLCDALNRTGTGEELEFMFTADIMMGENKSPWSQCHERGMAVRDRLSISETAEFLGLSHKPL